MNRSALRPLFTILAATATVLLIAGPPAASATTGVLTAKSGPTTHQLVATKKGAARGSTTCSQLTVTEIQPLIANPITKVTVKPVTDQQYTGGTKPVGQKCVFAAGSSDSDALVVTVVNGPLAARAYAADLQGFGPVRVPGVGDKAARAGVDANGAASTTLLTSVKGSTYCSVLPQSDDVPGVRQLEEAAGAASDIGDKAYAEIAAAVGTVCNRIYGSGNTKPDLSGLSTAAADAPTTTTPDSLGQ